MKRFKKKVDYIRTCEQCGNESFCKQKAFKCKYCGWMNGVDKDERKRNQNPLLG